MWQCCVLVCAALLLTGCLKQELKTGLSEQEADEIIVALKESGIDAARERDAKAKDKGPGSWTVNVKGGDQNLVLAWRILQEKGLPREKSKGLDEMFSSGGLIPTPSEEKARLMLALSGELCRTLKMVAGVVDARVHLVLPDNSPLLEANQRSPTTASVLIKYTGAQAPLNDEEVKSLIARGIEGLQPDNVAVVFKPVPASSVSRDIAWYLGNQQILVVSLGLLGLSSMGCLALAARGRQQRRKLKALQQQFKAAPGPQQLAAAGKGAA